MSGGESTYPLPGTVTDANVLLLVDTGLGFGRFSLLLFRVALWSSMRPDWQRNTRSKKDSGLSSDSVCSIFFLVIVSESSSDLLESGVIYGRETNAIKIYQVRQGESSFRRNSNKYLFTEGTESI